MMAGADKLLGAAVVVMAAALATVSVIAAVTSLLTLIAVAAGALAVGVLIGGTGAVRMLTGGRLRDLRLTSNSADPPPSVITSVRLTPGQAVDRRHPWTR